ncbi:MAG: trimeric autotransporter adhesin, partial [Solirubrobacterales bacterium]|nr:trimeric autotransporter adhesin [Solirubrobacterales bacterium]
ASFGSYGLATQARGTLIRDFNGDGKNDIVVSNDQQQLALLRGKGDGTFRAQQNYDFAPSGAGQLAVGRINGDKRPDVVMAGSGKRSLVVFVARKGKRVFKKPERYPGPAEVDGIAVGDLNRDGRSDIVAVGGGSGKGGASNPQLYVLIARKGGGFQNAAITFLSGVYATDLTLADLNVDGRLDAIITHANGRLDILHGKGDGTLGSPRSVKSGSEAQQTIALRLNADRRPDLVVTGGSQNSVSVLLAKH